MASMETLLYYLTFDPNKFDNESVLRVPYEHSFAMSFERDFDMFFWRQHWVSKWHFSIPMGLLYLAITYGLVFLMRDRKPFELKNLLILWNGSLAIFSVLGVIRTWEEWFSILHNHGIYSSICYTYGTHSVSAHWYVYFTFSKLVELGDTIFLALRKRPLSFLHCYHHMSVLIITVQSGAEQLGPGRWFMCMNFGAHAVMYSYYTLVSCGYRFPKWISASVTTIQIVQLLTGVAISCILLLIKTFTNWPCQQSWMNLGICFFIYISYSALFLQFFQKAYLKTKKVE